MAKLPDFQVLGDPRDPSSGRPMPSLGTSPVGAAMEAFGTGAQQLGQVIGQMSAQQSFVDAAKIDSEVAIQRVDLAAKYQTDPDPATAPARFKADLDNLHKTALGSIDNTLVRSRLAQVFAKNTAAAYSNVVSLSAKNQQQLAGSQALEAASTFAKQGAASGDDESVVLSMEGIDRVIGGAISAGALTPEGGRQARSKAVGEMIMLTAQQDPRRAASMTDRLRGALDATHLLSIESAIRGSNDKAIGQSIADDVFNGRAPRITGAPATTNDRQAVLAGAADLRIDPSVLAGVMSYESSLDPNRRGGKDNKYFGLIQFGPEEQARYGIKPGMTIAEQMPKVVQYLKDRGLPPGADLSTIYRTINGGNPNAPLTASDGNGTIAQHIERIQTSHIARGKSWLGQATQDDAPPPQTDAPATSPAPDAPLTREQQRAEGIRITAGNPTARSAFLAAWSAHWEAKDAEDKRAKDDLIKSMREQVFSGGTPTEDSWVSLGVADRNEHKALRDVVENRGKPIPRVSVERYRDELNEMRFNDPGKLVNTDLRLYQPFLSADDYEKFLSAQAALKKPDGQRQNYERAFKAFLEANNQKGADAAKLIRSADLLFEEMSERGKKIVPLKDIYQMLDNLLLRAGMPGRSSINPLGWFGSQAPEGHAETYGEAVRTGKPFVPEIPAQDRASIVQAFARRGVTSPSEADIAAAYLKAKGIRQ